MLEYICPVCDGNEIQVNDRVVQEIDPVSGLVLHSETRTELRCCHCGWSGTAGQTVVHETAS